MKRLVAVVVVGSLFALFWVMNYEPGESDLMSDVNRVPVVAATEPVPAGTSAAEAIASGLIELYEQEESFVGDDVVNDRADLSGVSAEDLAEGTVITVDMFG